VAGSWDIFPKAQSQTLSSASQDDQVPAAELASAIDAQKQAAATLTRSASFDKRIQELIEKARKKGTVSVMVKVRAAFKPEGYIVNAAESLAQRQVIKEAQDQMLSWLKYIPSTLKRYESLPYISVGIDEAGLEQLQGAAEALDVSENKPLRLALSQSLQVIGAQRAWASQFKGTGKTIAVIDSGVDKNHPWLSGKVVSEACYSTTNDEGYSSVCPHDETSSTALDSGVPCTDLGGVENCGHGTHIAGIAAGRGGVAYDANIISIQVMSFVENSGTCRGQASCLLSNRDDVVSALNRVFALRNTYAIAAANVSLAGDPIASEPFSSTCDTEYPAMTDAINQLRSVNIPTVIASGNDAASDAISFPACISTAVSVGAIGDGSSSNAQLDTVLQSSNVASFLTLLAPGGLINSSGVGGVYPNASGTSQAAAHVSGAMALLRDELPVGTNSAVWFDDALPAGAVPAPDNSGTGGFDETWNWVSANPTPYSGTASHQSSIVAAADIRQHYFMNATSTLQIGMGDILYAWVYLDPEPANKPSEIMLQWHSGLGWAHRAYWGENSIEWGEDGTPSRINMGRLPEAGRWVKLVVPARAVGLEGVTVNGMAFTQKGGRVTWDRTGKESASVDDLLNLLKSTGKLVTDTRPNAVTPAVPRINVGAALGVSELEQAWIAEYYNNLNLEGEPELRRREEGQFLDRYYNGASPAPGFVGAENYSVRWTRKLTLSQGNYRFSVTGDDGVRLYINGESMIPADGGWRHQSSTTYNVDKFLPTGNHDIKLEYFQGAATAQLRLHWGILNLSCLQNAPLDHWQGEYFNNANLAGTPVMRRDDGVSNSLNFNWGGGGPTSDCNLGIFPDYFSVRWTRSVNLAQGTHRFTISGDDWVRLLINDHLWFAGTGTQTIEVPITTSDNYKIVLEFTEIVGNASVSLCIAPPQISVVSVSPSTYQAPDLRYVGWNFHYGVDSPSITGHGSSSALAVDLYSLAKSCRWSAFQNVSGAILRITLRFDWSAASSTGSTILTFNSFGVVYSTDGGGSWTSAVGRSFLTPGSDGGSVAIDLPASTPLGSIQLSDILVVQGSRDIMSVPSELSATISNIRLEVERVLPGSCAP
jgi:subtilisin family serine protease